MTADLSFRDPDRAAQLRERLAELTGRADGSVRVMHVCGSHEEAIAEFGLRSVLPDGLTVAMGPGCPVCVTDLLEVDEAVALAEAGHVVATYGDMVEVPGTERSLADASAEGADVRTVYSASEAVGLAEDLDREVVFFATGFETTAAPTATVLREGPPENFSVLSAHKYVPPAMDVVASLPETRIDGFLAAGHAATITGVEVFEDVAERHGLPVVVGGFEPLDILAGLVYLLEDTVAGTASVTNAYPRCVADEGNAAAREALWAVFERVPGEWRGIAEVPDACLELREPYAEYDARRRFDIETPPSSPESDACICGEIMAGQARPADCPLLGEECTVQDPVGACMVSDEGPCRIRREFGGVSQP
jgi:hydrogenase expression/formation protein HypD